ncbi:hypothetical protein RRG08_059904 [Elysia crispata]|uniref:Uncharacterized protein n=1 Tax=Elysia crispata TaxID=231223 RepID=A0AAE0Y7M6_9GAST|nr:hypothetical protein RRG08_059904 [Elysia crispata]
MAWAGLLLTVFLRNIMAENRQECRDLLPLTLCYVPYGLIVIMLVKCSGVNIGPNILVVMTQTWSDSSIGADSCYLAINLQN